MRDVGIAVALVLLALVLTAFVPGVNPEIGTAPEGGNVAGFWLGLWHGIIAPVTFVISLFTDKVNLYEVHNSGNWYDPGFVLGGGILFGGGFGGARSGRR
jgi:hypothetical protein